MNLNEMFEALEMHKKEANRIDTLIIKTIQSVNTTIATKYHKVGFLYEFGDMKFYIENNAGHKTVLFWTDLPTLIKNLKALKKQIEDSKQRDSNGKKKKSKKTRH